MGVLHQVILNVGYTFIMKGTNARALGDPLEIYAYAQLCHNTAVRPKFGVFVTVLMLPCPGCYLSNTHL